MNIIIRGNLNVNSKSSKVDHIKLFAQGKIDVFIFKLDSIFLTSQFKMDGCSEPYCFDRNKNGGGFLIYISEDIPSKLLANHELLDKIEGIFLELDMRKKKWLVFEVYNPSSQLDKYFSHQVKEVFDMYIKFCKRCILIGDFNAEVSESCFSQFLL